MLNNSAVKQALCQALLSIAERLQIQPQVNLFTLIKITKTITHIRIPKIHLKTWLTDEV